MALRTLLLATELNSRARSDHGRLHSSLVDLNHLLSSPRFKYTLHFVGFLDNIERIPFISGGDFVKQKRTLLP
jgi:hypothetical protein